MTGDIKLCIDVQAEYVTQTQPGTQINTRYNQESGTPNGAKSGCNTKDRKNRHPITSKLIIIIMTTYFKNSTDKVHSAVDSLKVCCLKMALCGRNM
jgi:hypothetical protein